MTRAQGYALVDVHGTRLVEGDEVMGAQSIGAGAAHPVLVGLALVARSGQHRTGEAGLSSPVTPRGGALAGVVARAAAGALGDERAAAQAGPLH